MKEIASFFTTKFMWGGIVFLILTAVDGLIFGWNSDTTIYATIAVIMLTIFLFIEIYIAPEENGDSSI